MEREQIIKALECCQFRHIKKNCDECKYHRWCEPSCRDLLCQDALSLIKELTEENESLSQSLANVSQSLANSKAENERLKLEYAGFKAGAKDAVSFVKADTARKMQERFIAEIEQTPNANEHFIKAWKSKIDQIAKEMLENT